MPVLLARLIHFSAPWGLHLISFVFRRLSVAIPTLLTLIVFSFLLMEAAPGSPFGPDRNVPSEVMARLEAFYGPDRPLLERLSTYVWNVVIAFDFGPSFVFEDRTVNDVIAQSFPITLSYAIWAFAIAVIVGSGLGIMAAVRHGSWLDYLAVGISFGARVLPSYIMGPILILLFALSLGGHASETPQGGQWSLAILPVIALATYYAATIARMSRTSMLDVLNSNFIRTARAKGLPEKRIVLRHALKPAMMPVLGYLGPAFVGLMTGAIAVDVIFSTGGIGQYFVEAARAHDYAMIVAITILMGAVTLSFKLIVDIAFAWIDPKFRV